MRIFLVGFMCSGKSRVGRELAALMGLRHVDTDRLIEQRIGPITPWFQQHGEAAFREQEQRMLAEVLAMDDVVVSTGGGMPMTADNMERMVQAGTVVFLDVPFDVLQDRIRTKGGDRPVLFGLHGDALQERVGTLLAERLPFYRKAGMRLRADALPDELARRIRDAVNAQAM